MKHIIIKDCSECEEYSQEYTSNRFRCSKYGLELPLYPAIPPECKLEEYEPKEKTLFETVLIPQMSRKELEERLIEQQDSINELKKEINKVINRVVKFK
jgi:hypothetical protein